MRIQIETKRKLNRHNFTLMVCVMSLECFISLSRSSAHVLRGWCFRCCHLTIGLIVSQPWECVDLTLDEYLLICVLCYVFPLVVESPRQPPRGTGLGGNKKGGMASCINGNLLRSGYHLNCPLWLAYLQFNSVRANNLTLVQKCVWLLLGTT